MRLLLNENVPWLAVEALRRRGHDVLWAHEVIRGAADPKVLELASLEGRVLVTFDKDFGELAFRPPRTGAPGIVLFRTRQPSAREVAEQVVAALEGRSDWVGHFAVIEPGRIRLVQLPGVVDR